MLQSCTFCRPLSPIEHGDPPSATTAATLHEKMQGFAPESVFKPDLTRSRSLTLPNYLHHDVVAMSRYSLVHLLQASSSKKCSGPDNFLNDFYVKSSSCYSPVLPILSTTFSDRAAKPRKRRPSFSATTATTLPEKMQGFAPESVFKPDLTRSRSLTLPNYLHHDAVAMMIDEIKLSLQSRAPFVDLIFQKRSGPDSFLMCFAIFM